MTTETITIQGHDFSVPNRYGEGATLTAGEASALNQTYHENLRNNFAGRVKKAKEEAGETGTVDVAALQAALDEYAQAYQFGVRTPGAARAPSDPIGKEAFSIAKDAVKNAMRAKGIQLSAYSNEQLNELAQQALDKHGEKFRGLAEQRIKERSALASDLFADETAPAPTPAPEGEAPVAKRGKKAA